MLILGVKLPFRIRRYNHWQVPFHHSNRHTSCYCQVALDQTSRKSPTKAGKMATSQYLPLHHRWPYSHHQTQRQDEIIQYCKRLNPWYHIWIPVFIISSYKGDGWHSSINTGSMRSLIFRLAVHNNGTLANQSPTILGTTTAMSISLSSLWVPLLYDP